MFGEPVQTRAAIGIEMRDRSLRCVLLAARASGVVKWDHCSGWLDAPINFRGSGNKSIPGQPCTSAKHWRSELKNVGKTPDAGISAFGFRACNEGSHRGTRHRNVRVFGGDDHFFVGGKSGEDACASQPVSQVQTDGQLGLVENLVATLRHSANLLHSRSPFSCDSSTSINWERIASRADRPSHLI